jgi:uncharacterized HAD superfamily protein
MNNIFMSGSMSSEDYVIKDVPKWRELKDGKIIKHKGLRLNDQKLRYDLLPPYAIEQLVEVLSFGCKKYDSRNWERGLSWTDTVASLKRHTAAFEKGEDFDKESLLLHTAHIMWNAMALTQFYKTYPQGDDRPHGYLTQKKIGLDIDGVLADFTGHLLRKIGYPDHKVTHWNDPVIRKGFEEHKYDPEFWMDLPPLLSREDVDFEPHCYITARSVSKDVTQAWLDKYHFPTAPIYSIGIGESKVEVAKKAGMDIFVDDSFTNFVELNKAGICTFLYDAPYNQKYEVGFKRLKSLKELV